MKIFTLLLLSTFAFGAFAASEKELNEVGCAFTASQLVCSEQEKMAGYSKQLAAIKVYISETAQIDKEFIANQEHINVWKRKNKLMKDLIARDQLDEVIPHYKQYKNLAESEVFIPQLSCTVTETVFYCPKPISPYEASRSVLLFIDYVEAVSFLVENDSSLSENDRLAMEVLLIRAKLAQKQFVEVLHE